MATLKEHQAAMVDLLANGSGIPASASRLAHAMHDVLSAILSEPDLITKAVFEAARLSQDATTPGLNDMALSKPQKALKTDSPAKWPGVAVKQPVSAENRVKELENTIRQLKANLAHERACVAELNGFLELAKKTETKLRGEMSKWRAVETDLVRATMAENQTEEFNWLSNARDIALGYIQAPEPEQAGCRKDDTEVCDHDFQLDYRGSPNKTCTICGARDIL